MSYLPQVIKAKHVSGYIVATRFDDGTEKHVDISQWFRGPVFKPLKNPKFFSKFFVEGGTLAWPNGVDIAPEALYEAEDLSVPNKKRIGRAEKKQEQEAGAGGRAGRRDYDKTI